MSQLPVSCAACLDALPSGAVLVHPSRGVEYTNTVARQWLGWASETGDASSDAATALASIWDALGANPGREIHRALEAGASSVLQMIGTAPHSILTANSAAPPVVVLRARPLNDESGTWLVSLEDESPQPDDDPALSFDGIPFKANPHPMWVYDLETLALLDANRAALIHYGYTRDEFLALTLWDLRPESEHEALKENLAQPRPEIERSGPWVHVRADGSRIHVDILSHTITLDDGSPAVLVVAHDVSLWVETQRRLLQSRQLTHAVLDSLPSQVAVVDAEGTIIDVNSPWRLSARRIGNGSAPAGIGDNYWALFQDEGATEHAERIVLGLRSVLRGERDRFDTMYPCPTDDGGERWFGLRAVPLQHDDGGLVVSHIDITDARAQEEQLRMLQLVVEHANEAVMVTEAPLPDAPEPRIEYVNPAFTTLTGYAKEQVMGKTLRILQGSGTSRKALDRIRAALEAREPVREEIVSYTKDGQPYWVEMDVFPVTTAKGQHTHLVSVLRDVTDRVVYTEQLRMAKQQAEEANELKSAMLANMSHELRTPLTSIIGFAEVLEEELSTHDTNRRFAHLIGVSGRRLLETLESVLQLSKLEAGLVDIDPEPLDVVHTVRETVALLQPRAQSKGVSLSEEVHDASLHGTYDAAALHRVLTNLVDNAIKFTPAGGDVSVVVERNTEANVQLHVVDTGPGIDPAFQERMFSAFTQESTGFHRTHEGGGLGLAIVQRLVHLMEGTIAVDSTPGEGTTFTVTLPL